MTQNRNLSILADNVTTSGVLNATGGGTGQSAYTTGDVLYASSSNTLSKLNIGSNGQVLTISGGLPSWGGAPGATISNDTATATFVYPLFANATSGNLTTAYTGNAKLLYKPSTGELQSSEVTASNGLFLNSTTVAASYTIGTGYNAFSVGPVTISSGISVTVTSGQRWVVI